MNAALRTSITSLLEYTFRKRSEYRNRHGKALKAAEKRTFVEDGHADASLQASYDRVLTYIEADDSKCAKS